MTGSGSGSLDRKNFGCNIFSESFHRGLRLFAFRPKSDKYLINLLITVLRPCLKMFAPNRVILIELVGDRKRVADFFNIRNMHNLKSESAIFHVGVGIDVFYFASITICGRNVAQSFVATVFIFEVCLPAYTSCATMFVTSPFRQTRSIRPL